MTDQPVLYVRAGHILASDKGRPLCKGRISLSAPTSTIQPDSPEHPAHAGFNPESLCTRCRAHWVLAQRTEAAAVDGEEQPPPIDPADPKATLKEAVVFAYQLQKTRVQQGNRAGPQAPGAEVQLNTEQRQFTKYASTSLELLEDDAFKEVDRLCRPFPIYEWLRAQKGCGPTMAGVLIAYIDVHKASTVSSVWKWCGLDVVGGHAARREKGKKTTYNPWLKSKMIAVLGGSFIKCGSPWRKFYDDYKVRKQNTIVPVCMLCEGAKVYDDQPCSNCAGKGVNAPWGRSDAHRHAAAVRYMVKMFLMEFWKQWRTLEGLDVRVPYMEEYLGRTHHAKQETP